MLQIFGNDSTYLTMTGMIIGIPSGDENISAYKLKRLRRRDKNDSEGRGDNFEKL